MVAHSLSPSFSFPYSYAQLDPKIGKSRTRELTALFNSYRTRDHKVGREEDVLVTDVSTDRQYFVGHNKAYDQVLLPKLDGLMGKLVRVRYTAAEKHCLFAELLPGALEAAPQRPQPVQVSLQQQYVAPVSSELPEETRTILNEYHEQWSRGGVEARSEEPKKSKRQQKKEQRAAVVSVGIDDDIQVTADAAAAVPTPAAATTPAEATSPTAVPEVTAPSAPTSTEGATANPTRYVTPDGAVVDREGETYLYYKPNPHNIDTTSQNKTIEDKVLFNTAPYSVIKDDDEDPKRQIVLGIIFLLVAALLYRNLP